jgi:hypothetical protein
MRDSWPNMAGHVYSDVDLESLAALLAAAGLNAEVRTRVYSACVQYIRVYEGDDFTLESAGQGDYVAEAMSSLVEQMYAAAERVSSALIKLNIGHRLDVRDGQSRPVYRFQHLGTRGRPAPRIERASPNVGLGESSPG